jgi:hypothetical protein
MNRVEFVVVGGLATRLYMAERMTLDTDLLVRPGDVSRAEAALRNAGCERQGPLAIGGSTWRMPDGRGLDLVALDEPWTEEAVIAPVRGKDGLPYVALPYLVLMKLGAGRIQDLADISRMLGGARDSDIAETRRIVGRYRPQDVADLDSLIRLGKLEYEDRERRQPCSSTATHVPVTVFRIARSCLRRVHAAGRRSPSIMASIRGR